MSTASTPITEFSSEMNNPFPSGISNASFDVESFLNWDDSPASFNSQQLPLDYSNASNPSSASSTSLQLEPDMDSLFSMLNAAVPQVTGPNIFQQYSDSGNLLGIDFATKAQNFDFTFNVPALSTVAPSSLHSNDASPIMTPEMTRTNSNASKRSAETDESDEQPRKRPGRPRKTSVPAVNKSKPVQNAHATKLIHDKFYKNGRAERDTGLSRKVLDGFHTAEQLLAAVDLEHVEATKQLLEDAEEQRVKSRIDGQAQRAKVKKAKEELQDAKEQAESQVLNMKAVIAAYLAGQLDQHALKALL